MDNGNRKPHWQFLAQYQPTREEIDKLKKEQDEREKADALWMAEFRKRYPRRPARSGPAERRIGAPDERPADQQQERRMGPTTRRTPGSDRRNTKRTAG